MDDILREALEQRREQSLYRTRWVVDTPQQPLMSRRGKRLISFCSNDYLGFANHPKVIEAFVKAARRYGVGSGASHLVSGHSREHHALEEALADFTGRPRALLFSTGYMANLGVINALIGRGDAVFEDRLNHASLLDGGLLSAAAFVRYKHNDMVHLDQQLSKVDARRKLIVVDGVFSMDGDLANLPGLIDMAEKHKAWLMVDDAHGIGCIGETGRGTTEHFQLSVEQIPVLVGTLGKAFGTFGAFVAGSDSLIESLIQFARSYIYTTALPPAVAAATRVSLAILRDEPHRLAHLKSLLKRFRSACADYDLPLMPSSTPIQPLLLGNAKQALKISQRLEDKGFWITAIRPPTVPRESARLRVTLSAIHSMDQVECLVEALHGVLRDC